MKKTISLFLVFSVLSLSGNLYAKDKKGADLIIRKKSGAQVGGELITVKENSLLLKERDIGTDMIVDIGDIKVIRRVKKSKFGKGLWTGALVGGGVAGSIAGIAKVIRIKGKSDSEIQVIKAELRAKARI